MPSELATLIMFSIVLREIKKRRNLIKLLFFGNYASKEYETDLFILQL